MTKQELASKIWETTNELRKKIKADEFKDYIIGFMFYKYLSDKEEDYIVDTLKATKEDLKDIDETTIDMFKTDLGYFIALEDLYSSWKSMGNKLGASDVSNAIKHFNENINEAYKNVFENIFSTLHQGLDKLGDNSGSKDEAVRDIVNLIYTIPTMHDTYDVLGYIYEFLMYKFATDAKRDGAYYTPNEVSILMSRIIANAMKNKEKLTIYDPTCGSGSLLLNIGKEMGKYIDKNNIEYYGQELITETYNLTRMNLVMKDIKTSNIFVRNGDTLSEDWPYFDEETKYKTLFVNAVASNPPYSAHWNPDKHENDPRFKYGLAPSSKADYAFLQHCLYHLQSDGIMTIVLPHGVLFRGGEEATIRKNLIENGHIETVIGLPANLFYAAGIPTIIMVLRKKRTSDDVLFIDASQGFIKPGKQNVLRERDLKKILDVIENRKSVENFAKLVSKKELIENDYNLNIPRYVNAKPKQDTYDLYSTMSGEVINDELKSFDNFWSAFPNVKSLLLDKSFKYDNYSVFKKVNVKDLIHNDKDVNAFKDNFNVLSNEYQNYLILELITNILSTNAHTIDNLTKKLFDTFGKEELVDKYAIYQVLAEYWTMIETDLEIIRDNGIEVCKEVEPNMVVKKEKNSKKTYEEQKGWKGRICPFDLIKQTFFAKDFEEIKNLESKASEYSSEYTEIFENLDEDIKNEVRKYDKEGESKDEFDDSKLKSYISLFIENDIIPQLTSKRNDVKEEYMKIVNSLEEETRLSILDKSGEKISDKNIKIEIKKSNDEVLQKLETIVKLVAKEKELNKPIKTIVDTLISATKEDLNLNTLLSKIEDTTKIKILSQYDENVELLEILKKASQNIVLEKDCNSKIKKINEELEIKTKEKIENLTNEEINQVLIIKWINPIIDCIKSISNTTIDDFAKGLETLKNKYSNPLSEIETSLISKDKELNDLMNELVGSKQDLEALELFKQLLQ